MSGSSEMTDGALLKRLTLVTNSLDRRLEGQGSQLAANANELLMLAPKTGHEIIGRKHRGPILTIFVDDGHTAFMSNWSDVLDAGIPVTIAVITDNVGQTGVGAVNSYMTWDNIKAMVAKGAEVALHASNHINFTALTELQMRTNLESGISALKAHGLRCDLWVYPGGGNDATVRRVARDYFRAAFAVEGTGTTVARPPINQYNIRRFSIVAENPINNPTVQHMKDQVDAAVSNNAWLTWMAHDYLGGFSAEHKAVITEAIAYAQTKGVEILSASDALDRIGNIYDVGDGYENGMTTPYDIVDCGGKHYIHPAFMPSMELIETKTLDTAANQIVMLGVAGNVYLRAALVRVTVPVGASDQGGHIIYHYGATELCSTRIATMMATASAKKSVSQCEPYYGIWKCRSNQTGYTTTSKYYINEAVCDLPTPIPTSDIPALSTIYLSLENSAVFPVGTVVEVYGVKISG